MKPTKFRGRRKDNGEWVEGDRLVWGGRTLILPEEWAGDETRGFIGEDGDTELVHDITLDVVEVDPDTVGQWTGLKDKNGRDIWEGDVLRVRWPDLETQTHYGDNIPNGEYTEPLEPVIREEEVVVEFADGAFCAQFNDFDDLHNIHWHLREYDSATAQQDFTRGYARYEWGGEEGCLAYLLDEYKLESEEALLRYLGVEVIGTIHDKEATQ